MEPENGATGTSSGRAIEGMPEKSDAGSEHMDDLKKWLAGDETGLLNWLSEPEGKAEIVPVSPEVPPEANEIRDKAEAVLAEISAIKDSLLDELNGPNASSAGISPEVLDRLQVLFGHYDGLKSQLQTLVRMNENMRRDFQEGMASLPEDQEQFIRQRLALSEKESVLEQKEKDLCRFEKEGEGNGEVTDLSHLEDRFTAELREKDKEFREKERDYRAKIEYLAEELKHKTVEAQQEEEELRLAKMSMSDGSQAIDQKFKDLQLKEKKMLLMEEQIARLKIEIRERDDELKKIREVIGYKEQEMMRQEEDLEYREKLLSGEKQKVDDAKKEAVNLDEIELKRRLEELKSDVQRKEEELIAKEKYLNAKSEDLRSREQGLIEDEITKREEERVLEIKAEKVKTGNPRFDDLLLGGIPFGSNVLIHGPPFIGKELLIGQFVAEGLKKGVPAIWVTTDKTPKDIRDEMNQVISGYEEYERIGLVRYIDAYSRSMGENAQDPYTMFIDEPTDHEKIMEYTEKTAREFKEKHKYYRLAFRSLSTLIAYSDPNSAFRFLNPFCGRRKRDGAVSFFTIEKGVHGEQEIQMLGSIMDGMVDFKLDQLKTYFSVQGICDVQSRSYIRYTVGKRGLSIGSFSLDHIR